MGTTFQQVIDLALIEIRDYKLDKIYRTNQEMFKIITEGFLIRGLPLFYNCRHSLEYDLETSSFINTLTPFEMKILSDIWIEQWLTYHTNNLSQFENVMTPNDFKRHSEAENLNQKVNYLDIIREKYSQEIVEYGYLNTDWKNWGNGIF